jgi:hypothetical protein
MQLKVFLPTMSVGPLSDPEEFTVNSEADILKLGFAAARAVRAWVKRIPLVPSRDDLQFPIRAEMEGGESAPTKAETDEAPPRPKRKRKASK